MLTETRGLDQGRTGKDGDVIFEEGLANCCGVKKWEGELKDPTVCLACAHGVKVALIG